MVSTHPLKSTAFIHISAILGSRFAFAIDGNEDPKDISKPVKIQLFPPSALLEGNGATQQMTVLANYSDGTTRDITPLAVFQSSNDVSASIDEKGMVTSGTRGEAFIMARFNIFTVGVPIVVIPEDLVYQRP